MNEIKNRLTQLIKEGKLVLSTKYRPINQLHPMQQCHYIVNEYKTLSKTLLIFKILFAIVIPNEISAIDSF